MEAVWNDYLLLLDEMAVEMNKLAGVTREVCAAVRRDDLVALNDAMKQQQVSGLSLRGKEKKRQKLAGQLGLEGTRLSALPDLVPPELFSRAQETAGRLHSNACLYQEASQVARTTLEINLHELEKYLSAHGVDPNQLPGGGPAAAAPVQPPENMKTDFHA